jgi:hypothetical protein
VAITRADLRSAEMVHGRHFTIEEARAAVVSIRGIELS